MARKVKATALESVDRIRAEELEREARIAAADAHEAEVTRLWGLLPQEEKERVLKAVQEDASARTNQIHEEFEVWLDDFNKEGIKHDTWMLWAVRVGMAICALLTLHNFIIGNWGIGLLNIVNIGLFFILQKQTEASRDRHIASMKSRHMPEDKQTELKEKAKDA